MRFRAKGPLLLAFAALAIGLAGCSTGGLVATAPPSVSAASATAVQPAGAEATATVLVQSTEAPTAPPVREDQYATDPTTVDLAIGRPTLVKFFAFW
jgi:hypothetical protein